MHEISNGVVYATSKASDQPAHTRSLIRVFACRLNVLRVLGCWLGAVWCLSLKGGCASSSGSALVGVPHCCGSRVTAHIILVKLYMQTNKKYYLLLFCQPRVEVTSCFVHKVMGLTFYDRINTQLIYRFELAQVVARRIAKLQRKVLGFYLTGGSFFYSFFIFVFLDDVEVNNPYTCILFQLQVKWTWITIVRCINLRPIFTIVFPSNYF